MVHTPQYGNDDDKRRLKRSASGSDTDTDSDTIQVRALQFEACVSLVSSTESAVDVCVS